LECFVSDWENFVGNALRSILSQCKDLSTGVHPLWWINRLYIMLRSLQFSQVSSVARYKYISLHYITLLPVKLASWHYAHTNVFSWSMSLICRTLTFCSMSKRYIGL